VTEIQRQVGLRIRWARECVEPNRAAFARVIGVDRTTLQKIEDGNQPPSIFTKLEIAHRLRDPRLHSHGVTARHRREVGGFASESTS
jgi:DNA-binding XRE family transcriptional regulator